MSQFIDQVRIKVRSGDGGNGMTAWRREKYEPMGGPAGGDGGRGGSVFIEATPDLNTLIDFRYIQNFEVQPGGKGRPKSQHGKDADDLVIRVPVGTLVRDLQDNKIIADLIHPSDRVMVAEGGRGGRGNARLASPTRRAPYFCEPGQPGIERDLELELKLLADVGIIGLPNAGKSTLLSLMTAAKPKIADYPFSTLEPNLGVMKKPEGGGYVLADIPGLIEGASEGLGLGHKFLRHTERTRLLVHMVDSGSADPFKDIKLINDELHKYSETLEKLPQILVLNKADLLEDEDRDLLLNRIKTRLTELMPPRSPQPTPVLVVSCATRRGLDELKNLLYERLSILPEPEPQASVEPDERATDHADSGWTIERQKKIFYVIGDRIDRLAQVTDLRSPESLSHFYGILRAMGVISELQNKGIQPGQEVVIGGMIFTFGEGFG